MAIGQLWTLVCAIVFAVTAVFAWRFGTQAKRCAENRSISAAVEAQTLNRKFILISAVFGLSLIAFVIVMLLVYGNSGFRYG